jgi:N utilization substance protein B
MKKPGSRRQGRELAVQLLYQLDHNSTPLEEILPHFFDFKKEDGQPLSSSAKARAFAEELVRGVAANRDEIDERIRAAASNFELHRIGGVERAILRLAIFEMLHSPDVPPVVAINEAIDVAKKFTSPDGPRFINGVLDQIRTKIDRPARTPSKKRAMTDEQMAKAGTEDMAEPSQSANSQN